MHGIKLATTDRQNDIELEITRDNFDAISNGFGEDPE